MDHQKNILVALEIIKGITGWCWFAACGACIYFVIRAIFYSGSWWCFWLSLAAAFILYHVSLAYQSQWEKEARGAHQQKSKR
jgi:membrane protein implicated in regulation of membrane protease activity